MTLHPASVVKELAAMRDEVLNEIRAAAAGGTVPSAVDAYWAWVHTRERRLDALEAAIAAMNGAAR